MNAQTLDRRYLLALSIGALTSREKDFSTCLNPLKEMTNQGKVLERLGLVISCKGIKKGREHLPTYVAPHRAALSYAGEVFYLP
jgi:hypothetical protein